MNTNKINIYIFVTKAIPDINVGRKMVTSFIFKVNTRKEEIVWGN